MAAALPRPRSIGTGWRAVAVVQLVGFAVLAWICGSAWATTATSQPMPPPEIAAALPTVALQGRGNLRFFGLAVYEARLWAAAGFEVERYEKQPFALELRYARALTGPAIAERSMVEMRRGGSFDDEQARIWQLAMTRAFPDVAPGDRISGLHYPDGTTRFFHNGQPTTVLVDAAFARRFFGIWLASSTSEPGLRRQLIGQSP